MDQQRFDEITKALASGTTRRAVMRRLGAGLAGLGVLVLGRGTVDAAPDDCAVFCADQPGARKAQCRQTCKACAGGPRATCFDDATNSFTCNSVVDDPLNCGGCGQVCQAPFTACSGGECICPSGTSECGGSCVNTTCLPGTVFSPFQCACVSCQIVGFCTPEDTGSCRGGTTACENGCCCSPSGTRPCTPNQPNLLCCSGMCGPDGLCA